MTEPSHTIHPEVLKIIPGTVGAIVALGWIKGTWPQRVTALIGGSAASYYGASYMASALGTDHGLTGFLIGLFGMAIASKFFEALQALDLGARLDRMLTRWGL